MSQKERNLWGVRALCELLTRLLSGAMRGHAALAYVAQEAGSFEAFIVCLRSVYPALFTSQAELRDLEHLLREGLTRARTLERYRLLFRKERDVHARDVPHALRVFSRREKLRLALRELAPSAAPIATTARETALLGQICTECATDEALAWGAQRYGAPLAPDGRAVPLVVLGMGKLGGLELNVGSDVDLIVFYGSDHGSLSKDGIVSDVSMHEFFTRVTTRLVATLDDASAGAPVFRVDLRLRPEGAAGALVNSFAAAERYYESWGRTWERAALLRARPVAGNLEAGEALLAELSSFVWRKAVDPKIARDMTALAERIQLETRPDPWDLKLAPGGIREAEFFVQTLQLIWGGKNQRLRKRPTLEALRSLKAAGHVTEREYRAIAHAYAWLRTLEHRVQFALGVQTHVLPAGELRERFAESVGLADAAELEAELNAARAAVRECFTSLVPPAAEALAGQVSLESVFYSDNAKELAKALDLPEVSALDTVAYLRQLAVRPDSLLGEQSTDRHPELLERTLVAVRGSANPELAARGLALFFGRIVRPAPYVHAVATESRLIERLTSLFATSRYLGDMLIGQPHRLDALLTVDSEIVFSLPPAGESGGIDDETFVGALRREKARATLQCGVLDLAGELRVSTMQTITGHGRASEFPAALSGAPAQGGPVGTRLTRVADWVCEAVFERVAKGLPLALVALGKFGGRELGYGSDLDLIFLYDEASAPGASSVAEAAMRAAQKMMRLLSWPHGEGPGYELDTRLRPSGNQGLLVVSLESFARYHGLLTGAPRSEDWERQTLVRARFVAGCPQVGATALRLMQSAAYEVSPPRAEKLLRVRARLERELGRETAHAWDLKWGRGGVVDVEFAVQFLQRKYGHDLRIRTAETRAALRALSRCGYLDEADAEQLEVDWDFLRSIIEHLRIVHGTSVSRIESDGLGLSALARSLGLATALARSPRATLLAAHQAATARNRATFERLVMG